MAHDLALCSNRSIDGLFGQAAVRFADREAVVGDTEALRYRDLDGWAAQFARFLARHGVRRGDHVALLAGRSVRTIVAILGILKAGAAYVPLDIGDPPERLANLLADSAPSLVLSAGPCAVSLVGSSWRVLDLDEALAASRSEPDGTPPTSLTGGGDTACIMYTSGSTGRPKGVIVPHRGIVRLVTQQTFAPFGSDETYLHLAPLAFDASSLEIWGALLHGGRLAIVEDAQPSLDVIAEAIARHRVTTAWFTAGLFHVLVDHRVDALRPLRCILAGGDVVSPAHVRRAYAALPDCRIVNGYGPTENTTFTCCYPIPREGWGGGPVPIGSAIDGTTVHLLGPDLTPVEVGDQGQIACAGDGLAQGYLNQPQSTAAAFVHLDLGGGTRERVYLTGDLARQRPDGTLEFSGRADFQIKVDGKRVELGEIENTLRADPAVADAIVTARDTDRGGRAIAAYLRLRRPQAPDIAAREASAVLERLRSVLPAYMVPARATVLEAFPLTPNGKVDRTRLPLPERPQVTPPPRPTTAPDTETRIAAAWARVLGLTAVERDANFFDLGGTSLGLMALHAELRGQLGPGLSLMTLFEHTSIRALASFLDGPAPGGARRPARPFAAARETVS